MLNWIVRLIDNDPSWSIKPIARDKGMSKVFLIWYLVYEDI